jgi:hypothetical protein
MRSLKYLLVVPVLLAFVTPAPAIKPFYDEFKKEYLDKLKDKKFVEAVDKGMDKCFVCHQGKVKKNHNAFGEEFITQKLLTKKDGKETEKMHKAFKKVLAMHVDPKNDKSETYMQRLEKSQWPGGKLEDLKKEPKKDEKKEGETAQEETKE